MCFKVITLFAAAVLGSSCFAASFSQMFVFGDSLSDNGNAYIASLGVFPGPNYGKNPSGYGFYSDGPNTTPPTPTGGPVGLWVDQLAPKLGVADPLPFLPPSGGTNFAVASGETGTAHPQDMQSVLNNYFLPLYGGHAPSNALYTLWGGSNDINHALASGPVAAVAAGKTAADNVESEIMTLHANGGQTFLWLNLPNLGQTPGAIAAGIAVQTEANLATAAFNQEYALDLQTLITDGIHVIPVDINALFNAILLNPSAYGFADTTDGCISVTGYTSANPCSPPTNPNTYLFWDDEHPTTAADALVANAALAALVPEPTTYALMLIGGCGLLAVRRRLRTGR
jgi:outer membrane lipase/esterase